MHCASNDDMLLLTQCTNTEFAQLHNSCWLSTCACDLCMQVLAYFMYMGYLLPLQAIGVAAMVQRVVLIAAACTLVESLPSCWLDDNITVPATAAWLGALWLPGSWPAAAHLAILCRAVCAAVACAAAPHPVLLVGTAANSVVFAAGLPVLRNGLSDKAIAHAWLLGSVVYGAFGAGSYMLMCLYFIIGTLVSDHLSMVHAPFSDYEHPNAPC
jgi:hypothetical protein